MTKRGMVIFVGATGTGKSTSLAAMVGYRNHHSTGHIITIEDPIEFVHEHDGCIITQREVGVDTEILRGRPQEHPATGPGRDPHRRDSHPRDHGSRHRLLRDGHLVMATLHANNANQALDRIINFFPEEARTQLFMDLSLNLKSIVAQQLAPRKGGNGRRAVVEVLINTPLASDMIRKGESTSSRS